MRRQGRIAALAEEAQSRNVHMTSNPEAEERNNRGKALLEKRRETLTVRLQQKDEHIGNIRERRSEMLETRAIEGKLKQV
jgi:hypothetical protein